jgi:hypothetical protein
MKRFRDRDLDRTLTADEFAQLETGVAEIVVADMPRILPPELHHSWGRVAGILAAMTAVVVAVIVVLVGQQPDGQPTYNDTHQDLLIKLGTVYPKGKVG